MAARWNACQMRLCRSGKVATRHATENLDDAAYRTAICQDCFRAMGLHWDGQDIPEDANAMLRAHYQAEAQHGP